jgi:hypothetical protein
MDSNLVVEISRQVANQTIGEHLLYYLVLMAVAFLAVAASAYFGAYFKTRGTNLATRADIEKITDAVEKIRAQYQLIIEQGTRRHQLRLAALERRLQAHQEAYALWWELLGHATKQDEIGPIVMECQAWWVKNCLYLDEDARKTFYHSFLAAHLHPVFFDGGVRDPDGAKANWNTIMAAGDAIAKGVELPSIGNAESELREMMNIRGT